MVQQRDLSSDGNRPQPQATAAGLRRIVLALAAAAAVTCTAAAQSATMVPVGTSVKVKLLQFISSETSQPGQAVHFEVFQDVVAGNRVAIAQRTPVLGSITKAKAYSSLTSDWPWWTKPSVGALLFAITHTRSVDGRAVQLSGPVVGANESKMHTRIRWYHEGEVFDAIVVDNTNGGSY